MDDFDNIKVIGRGSYGKVFLVRKKDANMLYAMKVIKKERLANEKDKENTLIEKTILLGIKSPFLVQLHYSF